jgi:hypothetical protein
MAVSLSVKAAVLFAWGNKCFYCGRAAEGVDHIVPLEKKGTDDAFNLLSACSICNNNKRARWLPKPVLTEALEAAKDLSEFVIFAAKVFEESRKLASDRILYGSRPLVEGESGVGRDQRARRILRPARIVAKENAAIVNNIWAAEN